MTNNQLTEAELTETLDAATSGYPLTASAEANLRRVFAELQERRKADREPVAYTDERNLGYIDRGRETAYLWGKQNSEASDVALYRHAQLAPVVPELRVDWQENEFSAGWNACRAAILQAEPVTTANKLGDSPVIPDTWIPVSERNPNDIGRYWCYVEDQKSLGKSHYQWNCSWNGEIWGGAMMYGRVTHWMPLPNPPKE